MLHRVLFAARARMKLTLQDVANLTGLTVPFLSQLEHGKRRPSTSTLPILGEVLAIPHDELIEALDADNRARTKRQKSHTLTRS